MARRKADTEGQAAVNKIADQLARIDTVPQFVREHYFAPGKGWAFDIAWPTVKVALEYEGNTWVIGASRHTTGGGYRKDVDKYNQAAILGWCVIRVTADMVRDLSYLDAIIMALYMRIDLPELAQELEPQADPLGNGRGFEDLWREQHVD